MSLPISLVIILLVSLLFGWLAKKIHLSEVIGLIVAGLILSLPYFKQAVINGQEVFILKLAQAGLFSLMFLSGFEVSWSKLLRERRDALVITISTVLTSLILGSAVFLVLGFGLAPALIMGICFGITAEATKARVLLQLKKLKTKVGSLLLGAGIINDITGVVCLAVVTYIFTKNFSWQEIKVLAGVILAFFAGIGAHYLFNRYTAKIKAIEKLLLYLVVPFLFVNIGLNFNFGSLVTDYKILFIVIITATAGQLLGSFLTRPVTGLKFKQLYLIGWGMNSKGAVELAIALVALQVGILPVNLYSALVLTALVTTILFQLIIFRMVEHDPEVMD